MIRKILFIASAVILFTGALQLNAQDRAGKTDEFIQRVVDYNSFSGSVLIADNREVIFKKGYSFANREWEIKNTTDTKFRIGSITKQFTAAIILRLREEGKLKLDDKITDHIPYYRKDTGEIVTIHQLLVHTSGIPSYTSVPNFFQEISKREFTVEEFVKEYCTGDFNFEPGTDWAYNNTGYYLLGVIIEEITGMTYAEALQHYILDPLEMNDSGYDVFSEVLDKRATGYSQNFIDYTNSPYLNMELPYAAGGMYSTVEDMFKWDQALYEPGLLSEESLELFFKPHVEAMGGYYAYGWTINKTDVNGDGEEEKVIRHGGGINGFNTLIVRIPEKGQFLVMLNNTGGAALGFMSNQLLKLINDQDYEYPKKGIGIALYQKYEEEGIDSAIDYYNKLKESGDLEIFFTDRSVLNALGYYLMNNENDLDAAKKIFKLNMDEYPDWFNTYDSYAEILMEHGDDENAIEFYEKSLEMNPGNDNAIEKLKELGVEYEREVLVPAEVLASYTGTYELAPNFKIFIKVKDNQLFAKATGQPEFPVFPINETRFFYKVVEAEIEFYKNENGEVESLTLFQGGREMPGKKVE